MTRIIAGEYGGRRLLVPPGTGTRPTADRAREGLFSSLLSLLDLDGAAVLDLYAGSGALGLEALSRGAAHATLVDDDPMALTALRANVEALGAPATVVAGEVAAFLQREVATYDLVLVDPPYELDVDPVLADVATRLTPGGVLVVERRTRGGQPACPAGLLAERNRRYGEATLWYFSAP